MPTGGSNADQAEQGRDLHDAQDSGDQANEADAQEQDRLVEGTDPEKDFDRPGSA